MFMKMLSSRQVLGFLPLPSLSPSLLLNKEKRSLTAEPQRLRLWDVLFSLTLCRCDEIVRVCNVLPARIPGLTIYFLRSSFSTQNQVQRQTVHMLWLEGYMKYTTVIRVQNKPFMEIDTRTLCLYYEYSLVTNSVKLKNGFCCCCLVLLWFSLLWCWWCHCNFHLFQHVKLCSCHKFTETKASK